MMLDQEMQNELNVLKLLGQFQAALFSSSEVKTMDEFVYSVEGVWRNGYPERHTALYVFKRNNTNVLRLEYTVEGTPDTTRAVEFYYDVLPVVTTDVWVKILERMDDLVVGVVNKDETQDNDWGKVVEVVKEGGFYTDNFTVFTESMSEDMYSEYMNWLYATYITEVKERYPHHFINQGHGNMGEGFVENFTVYGVGDTGEISVNVKNQGKDVELFASFVKKYLHNGKKYTVSLPNVTLDISHINKKTAEQYFSDEILEAVDKLLDMYRDSINFELLEDEHQPFTFEPSDELTQAHLGLKELFIRDYDLRIDTVKLGEYGKVVWDFELEGETYINIEQLYWNPHKPYTLEEVGLSNNPEVVFVDESEVPTDVLAVLNDESGEAK